jgi:predicted nucleic acid-binding protein
VKYLVDANVLSEPTKPAPDPRIVAWLRAHEPDIAVDPVILGELRFGILILPKGGSAPPWSAGSTRGSGVSTVCPGTRTRD